VPWWFTPDVTTWAKSADEPSGLRPKHWVVDTTGTEWLRKESLSWRPTELAVEALTLELARRCGYPVAYGTCCTWLAGDQVVRGFISRKFQDAMEAQTSGGELIARHMDLPADLSSQEAEQQRRIKTTIAVTRTALEEQQQQYGVDLIGPFLRMLVFDAWIGNGDRHSANWAILVRSELHRSSCRLAPMYDTAGCLLANLTDATIETRFRHGLEDEAIDRYITKCRSGFGDGEQEPGILHSQLLESVRRWAEWQDSAPGLVSFFSNNLTMVDGVLDEVPDSWLSVRRKQLIRRLLVGRVKMLQGLTS
jgi:HipA-like C-terminal domain